MPLFGTGGDHVLKRLQEVLHDKRAEGYVDVVVLVLCAVLVLALAMRVLPVFIQKQQLDMFATELVREAEVSGKVQKQTDGLRFCRKRQGLLRIFHGQKAEKSS